MASAKLIQSRWRSLPLKRLLCITPLVLLLVPWGELFRLNFRNTFVPPYLIEYPDLKYGFGENIEGLVHSPKRAIEQLSNSLLALNKWLNGWYSGSIFFILAFFLLTPSIQKWDRLLLTGRLLLMGFYFFYIFQTLIFGARFLFLCAPFLLLLISRVCAPKGETGHVTMPALLLLSLVTFFPRNLADFIWIYDPANDPPEYLKIHAQRVPPEKKLIFLDPRIPQDDVNWNDPFLQENILFCRDLGARNQEMIEAFPQFKPFYFRPTSVTLDSGTPGKAYALFENPDQTDHSNISFFELVAALQNAGEANDSDAFDMTYPRLLFTFPAAPQLEWLSSEDVVSKSLYKDWFRSGLVHTARMVLLPRLAYEKGSFRNWPNYFDQEAFRAELAAAKSSFVKSGEPGKPLLKQLEKVERRIDLNRDKTLSDSECERYLAEKIQLFTKLV